MENSPNSMERFKEGEWVVLYQLKNKRLARLNRKGLTVLGKDSISLEGVIGCLPWSNFQMKPQAGGKAGRRMFSLEPIDDDEEELEISEEDILQEEERDNRTINDDGRSQSLSSLDIEALREEGLRGKEIVSQLVAGSATYEKKTRYSQDKYIRKKENKHCFRERVSVRKTSLSIVAEILCSGGGGEGSRGSIIGMRPDTLSQMLTALNIRWKRTHSSCAVKHTTPDFHVNIKNESNALSNEVNEVEIIDSSEKSIGLTEFQGDNQGPSCSSSKCENERFKQEITSLSSSINRDQSHGTVYVVYESGNWGLVVASLLTYLPSNGPKVIHLYPGHGVPCLIAPRALNLTSEKLEILASVNLKALLEKLGKCSINTFSAKDSKINFLQDEKVVNNPESGENMSNVIASNCEGELNCNKGVEGFPSDAEGEVISSSQMHNHEVVKNDRKRELEDNSEGVGNIAKKPRWESEAERAASTLTSCKADGLVVVACREHPVTIVIPLLSYLCPSRPIVVYCPYREPLFDLYAVLKGWEPWVGRYGVCGGKDGVPKVANLRLSENWLRNYQILPNRTHPQVNMSPGGGFLLTGVVVDFNDK